MSELLHIQQTLKAPKGQFNGFGKYKYRSCEDILEALKAPLKATECYIVISDDIVLVGDRYYIKATVELKKDGKLLESASAFARESLDKKGMDGSQITGTSSSYARKYALNGLFAIDDNKDADTNESTLKAKAVDNNESAPEAETIDIMPATKRINDAQNLNALAIVWTNINKEFKGKNEELGNLLKAKNIRKLKLQGAL
tara:strand:+ start:59 stop:658 length:600 start_codon:yes stop_codon:yes gene_type:complete